MTTTTSRPATDRSTRSVGRPDDLDRAVDWRRLWCPGASIALVAMAIAAILQSLGTVITGRLAANPVWTTVAALTGCLLGYALLDTVGGRSARPSPTAPREGCGGIYSRRP
jgi:ATP-binding cassette subfamily B protein